MTPPRSFRHLFGESVRLSFWFVVGGQGPLSGAFAELRRSGPGSFGALLLVVAREDCWRKSAERRVRALLIIVDRPGLQRGPCFSQR